MSLVRGLGNIRKHQEEVAKRREEAANFVKATWFQLKEDGESAEIRPLQELDESSPHYSAKNDLGVLAIEHSNPANFVRKALCTLETEGACVGEEMHQKLNQTDKDYKGGWKQKERLYINVLVKKPGEDPYVAVLSQGTSSKGIVPTLLEVAVEDGSITNRWFKITRQGTKQSTSYVLFPRKEDHNVDESVEDYELFDLNQVIRHVPYDEQLAHYDLLAKTDTSDEDVLSKRGGSVDPDESW